MKGAKEAAMVILGMPSSSQNGGSRRNRRDEEEEERIVRRLVPTRRGSVLLTDPDAPGGWEVPGPVHRLCPG